MINSTVSNKLVEYQAWKVIVLPVSRE